MKNLLTVTPEMAYKIKERKYFPFSIIWLTPKMANVPEPAFYVSSLNLENTPEYFAELLAHRAVYNNDMRYQRSVAKDLNILELFDYYIKEKSEN